MIIVKSKEDIKPGMYCKLTKENYEKVKELGFKVAYDTFDGFLNNRTYQPTDIFTFGGCYNIASWEDIRHAYRYLDNDDEFQFQEEISDFSVQQLGFLEPESFKAQIFTRFMTKTACEYIGAVNGNIPAKWDSTGICLNPSQGYNLYKEYNQRIYTKPNSPGFYPKQKFKISWTEAMSKSLEQAGWILATDEEIDGLKNKI